VVSELSCARRREPGPRGGPRAAAGSGGGSWRHEARGGPGAVLCPETGVGAMGHVAIPELSWALVAGARAMRHTAALELPCARRREPQDTRACVPILPFVFDLKLVCGVPGLQGTDIDHIQTSCGIGVTESPTIIYEDNVVCVAQMQT
jgi:hypothetical protein